MKDRRNDERDWKRGRRGKQLMDNLKEKRCYWKLKEEALNRTLWRRNCLLQTQYCMNGRRKDEGDGKRGKRVTQLLDNLKEKR
jgi:hypothetical protein